MESHKDPCPGCGGRMSRRSKMCLKCKQALRGKDHPAWKGGRHTNSDGYIRIYKPEDPRANLGRYMQEHTLIMEEFLGRPLLKHETVHHRNGDRTDNRIENLELWSGKQPAGQRVEDKLQYAYEIIALYEGLNLPKE